jgi:hypothetical protein
LQNLKDFFVLTSALNFIRQTLILFSVISLLAGCGGSGTVAGVGSGGTGSIAGVGSGGTGSGVVSGFGSLIVDGIRRNDAGAAYSNEADQGSALAMPLTGAMLGQSAEFSYDANGNISSVLMSPEIVGSVTAVSAGSITVLGTTIITNTDASLGPVTHFVGYASLANVQIGDRVEVHGLLNNGNIQATLIVQKPTTGGVRISGIVGQYNGTSFVLGSETVIIGSATINPQGISLANGQLVTVWSSNAPGGNTISASSIRIKRPAQISGNVTLSGPISSYVNNALFQIRNVTVDASTASVSPSGAGLGNGNYIVVVGSFDTTTNMLTASSITVFNSAAPTTVEVHGMVANYISTSSFTVRGVVIDASAVTPTGGTISNGVFLDVRGTVVNNIVHASTVNIVALVPSGSIIEVGGTINSYNATTGAYTMNLATGGSMSGNMGAGTIYRNGTATAKMVTGQSVNITGTINNNLLTSAEVIFQSTTPGSALVTGVAYNITSSSFMLNGVTINDTSGTGMGMGMGGGMMGGMLGGSRISVSIQPGVGQYAGQYMATAINML